MSPHRKKGICMTGNSIDSNRFELTCQPTTVPSVVASNSRAESTFVTFKGRHQINSNNLEQIIFKDNHSNNQNNQLDPIENASTDFKGVSRPPEQQLPPQQIDWTKFQMVPLDDGHRIKPVDLRKLPPYKQADPKPPFKFAGYVGSIGSSLCTSLSVFLVKLLPVEDTLQEKTKACMFRGISLIILCGLTMIYQGQSFKVLRGERMVVFLRATIGFGAYYGVYVAIQYISIGETSALVFSSPVWTCILGFLVLNEPLPLVLLLVIPLNFLGIILIAHPDLIMDASSEVIGQLERNHHFIFNNGSEPFFKSNHSIYSFNNNLTIDHLNETTEMYFRHRWPGVVVALATSLSTSLVFILLKMRRKTPISTCSFYLGVAVLVITVLIQASIGFGKMPTSILEWSLHVMIGFFGYGTQVLIQWSLIYEAAGTLSVVRTLDIVMSFMWSALFLDDDFLWTSVSGAIVIMLVVALLMLRGYYQNFCKSLLRSK